MKLSIINGALQLDGANHYGQLTYRADLEPAEFTICGMFKKDSIVGEKVIIGKVGGYTVEVSTNDLRFRVYDGVDYAPPAEVSNLIVADTTYFFVATYNSGTLTLYLYDDTGELLGSGTETNTISYAGSTSLFFGRFNATNYFDGTIGKTRIYDTALSLAQAEQWAKGKEFSDNEIVRFDFKEGSGTETKDSAGNKQMTIYNTPTWSSLDEDRTNYVDWKSLQKSDVKSSYADSMMFSCKGYGNRLWKPTVYQEIKLEDAGGTKLFAGVIMGVNTNLVSQYVKHKVKCKDYSELMDKNLVVETYENMTIAEIIDDINTEFMGGYFTTTNVIDADFSVNKITFNYERPTKCIKELAEFIGYDWYVDYDKDIHFFAKGTELSPISITDTNKKAIKGSLSLNLDNSQLRNVVYVRGGEYEGTERSEDYLADGDQDTIPLGTKFSSLPTVTVNAVSQTVGIENLNDFTSYDCLWDYNQKYLRFENPVTLGHVVASSGTPLIPVLVKVRDPESIEEYGIKEFKITDKTIEDKTTARRRGQAELEAYRDGVIEGSFSTYEDELRSGQEITLTSDLLGIDEKYIIQKMSMKMRSPNDDALYKIDIVSKKTLGIVDFLIKLLTDGNKNIKIDSDEVLEIVENIDEITEITEEINVETEKEVHEIEEISEQIRQDPWTPEWVFAGYFPSSDADPKRPGRLSNSFRLT